jgi:hypothetical protein
MKVTKTVIDFLKKYKDGVVPDADVHALSDKLGIDTHKLESVFYMLAAKYAQSQPDDTNESKLNEWLDDYAQIVDSLINSMEHMDKKEFVSFLSKETKYSPSQLAKVFDAYWKTGPEKFRWNSESDWAPWLNKFQITESKLTERADDDSDYDRLVDVLVNDILELRKSQFISRLHKKTKYTDEQLGKVYDAYDDLGSEKYDWVTNTSWKKFLGKFNIQESKLNEASVEAIAISKYTGTRPEAVDKFIAAHKMDAKKLLAIAVHGGLSDRMDIVTAMVGNPGNSIQKKLIAQLKEDVSRRATDFFDSKHGTALHKMFDGAFDGKKFDKYLNNLDKTISSDVKYGRIINKLASDAGIDTKQYDNKPLADLEKALKAKTSELYTDYKSGTPSAKSKEDDFSHLKGQSDNELSKLLDIIHKQQEINGKQYVTAKKAGQSTKEIEAVGDRLTKREKAVIDSRTKKLPSKPTNSDAKIKNPETGRTIKVSTALNYDKNSPAYKLAAKKVK